MVEARHSSNAILLFQIIKAVKTFSFRIKCSHMAVLPLIQVEEHVHLFDPMLLTCASLLLLLTNSIEPHNARL